MNFEIPPADILIKEFILQTPEGRSNSKKRIENGRKDLLKHVPISQVSDV